MPYPNKKKETIKELVIKQKWSKELPRSGDEYRSLSKQIDTFLDFMDDDSTQLYWMPIDVMTEAEIAQTICSYIKRNQGGKENRLLLHNLDYEGIKYNYFHFAAHTPSNLQSTEMIYEISPKLKDVQPLKIKEVMQDIYDLWGMDYSNKRKLSETEHWLCTILAHIMDEKNLYKVIGIGFTNPRYIEEYIDVITYTAKLIIKKLIIFNENIDSIEKIKCLTTIRCYLEKENPHMNKYVENSRLLFKEIRERFPCKDNDDMLSLYFALYMQRKAICDEIKIISSTIKNDLPAFELKDIKKIVRKVYVNTVPMS